MTDLDNDAFWKDHEKRMEDPRYAGAVDGQDHRITDPVTVQPWVVLYAIRYGMGRQSYADSDAARLITEHAAVLVAKGWVDTLARDIEERLLQPGLTQTDRVKWVSAFAALVEAKADRERAIDHRRSEIVERVEQTRVQLREVLGKPDPDG